MAAEIQCTRGLVQTQVSEKIIHEWEETSYPRTNKRGGSSLSLSIFYPSVFIQGNFPTASHLDLKHCPQKILCSSGICSREEWANILELGENIWIQVQVWLMPSRGLSGWA